jgi:ABC-type Fe3+-hydroxamate transport system substrate-binding protein
MRKMLACVLATVLLASAVPLAITPAAAEMHYEIPGDVNPHDDKLTKDELTGMILPYMLDKGDFTLDDIGDAAYVYTYWEGEPKTIIDLETRERTFYRPVERVVSTFAMYNRIIVALDDCDRLVGITHRCVLPEEAYACGGKLLEVPYTGYHDRNLEAIASQKPDVIFALGARCDSMQERLVTPVIAAYAAYGPYKTLGLTEKWYLEFEFFGKVLDKEEEAEELNSFIKEKLDKVFDVVSEIPDEEKPKACLVKGKGKVTSARSAFCSPFDEAGGISIKKDLGVSEISVEKLVEWNPDVIFITNSGSSYRVEGGYRETPLALTVEQVLADSQLQTVNAVKTGSVYYTTGCCCWVPHQRVITSTMYMAKIFYPDKLKDIDLEKDGNEVFERFYSVDGLYTEYADNMGYFREFIDNPPEEGKWQNVPE